MTRVFTFLVTLAIALLGCSGSADTTAAEQAVLSFHQFLDAGRFTEIYEVSSDELKKISAKSDFVEFLDTVHRRLGNVKSSEKQAWRVTYRTSGTFITLTYKTVYREAEATEEFVFRMQGHSAALAGYHINGDAQVVNRLRRTSVK